MLEFWILEGPLNTTRGTAARHSAAFGWLQHRRCRGTFLARWSKGNLLIRNTVRRPLILPKWQGIQCSQPSRWRGKEWNSFHFHIRLEHNRKEKKHQKNPTFPIQHSSTEPHIGSKRWLYTVTLPTSVLEEYFKPVRQLKENLFWIISVQFGLKVS